MRHVAPRHPAELMQGYAPAKKEIRRIVASFDVAYFYAAAALVIVERVGAKCLVTSHDFREPMPGEPFDTESITNLYLDRVVAAGCKTIAIDATHVDAVRARAAARGVLCVAAPSAEEKSKSWVLARELVRRRAVALPPQVAEHMSKIESTPRALGGLLIQPPKIPGLGHCELASVSVNAIWLDTRLHGEIGDAPNAPRAHKGRWGAP